MVNMIESLRKIEQDASGELADIASSEALEAVRVKYLGRKGHLASFSAQLPLLPPEQKPEAGREMNRVKRALEAMFAEKESALVSQKSQDKNHFDETMPGTFYAPGNLHPLTQVVSDILKIFERLGFRLVDGPEVETEYYNFEALNIPLNHPARDAFDTFYLDNGKLLRSQTSTVQIRVMEKTRPPFKIIAPGRVFRPDATDATHSFMFHQIEGLMVDERVSFADLKGVLFAFAE